jgi:hypothetical protein
MWESMGRELTRRAKKISQRETRERISSGGRQTNKKFKGAGGFEPPTC